MIGHEARSGLRRLASGLAHAWDAGDRDRWAAHLAPEATGLLDAWDAARPAEPWSLHWLTNEVLAPGGDEAEGRWLWLAASLVDGGTRAAWSAGDLALRARRTALGWRVVELTSTDRFRTPYDEGWLASPWVPRGAATAEPVPLPPAPAAAGWVDAEVLAADGSDAQRLAALAEEAPVRALLARHLRQRDEGLDGGALAGAWAPEGTYRVAGPDGAALHRGRADVADALDSEAALVSCRGRFLADQALLVDGDRARSWATDLWVAVAGGTSTWRAHRYVLDAVRTEGTWRIAALARTTVLDAPHATGWAPLPAAALTRP